MEMLQKGLSGLLTTGFIGRRMAYYPSLPSTMDVAKELARGGAEDGTTVIAGRQTSGRGRLGRTWLSPEGSLAMSVILHPEVHQLPQLVMAASLATVRAIRENYTVDARIKWPNDVLIRGKKVCGILIENELRGEHVRFAVIGIGLNINFDPSAYPEIATIATSLSAETGRPVSFEKTTAGLLNNLERYYLRLRSGELLTAEWRENMETIGQKVRLDSGTEIIEGLAEDVSDNGALIVRQKDGGVATVFAGDVTAVRD